MIGSALIAFSVGDVSADSITLPIHPCQALADGERRADARWSLWHPAVGLELAKAFEADGHICLDSAYYRRDGDHFAYFVCEADFRDCREIAGRREKIAAFATYTYDYFYLEAREAGPMFSRLQLWKGQ